MKSAYMSINMGNTHVLHIHNGASFSHEKEPSYIICRKMDRTGEGCTIRKKGKCVLISYVKPSKPIYDMAKEGGV